MGNFSTFITAIERAGFAGPLNNEGLGFFLRSYFILFAPRDNAFANAPSDGIDPLLMDRGRLRTFIGGHIIDHRRLEGQALVQPGERPLRVMTFQGTMIDIDRHNGMTVDEARVLEGRPYNNGIICAIDRVIWH